MSARSTSAAVRNPIASDPEVAAAIAQCPPEARECLRGVLSALAKKWRAQAEKSWRTHKPPMAVYWKQNAVNARHIALALRVQP